VNESYERRLLDWIAAHQLAAEHLVFERSCHSVAEAALAAGASEHDLVKNICLVNEQDRLIVAIVKGEHRVSRGRVATALSVQRPRLAEAGEILERTGYPCGGTPSFGFEALFVIDPKVMEMEFVYSGGGSDRSLVRIAPEELVKANKGLVVRIRS
jgi:Cys-tRNA(Pro)/Cys-tRNA(Cys) deacylase